MFELLIKAGSILMYYVFFRRKQAEGRPPTQRSPLLRSIAIGAQQYNCRPLPPVVVRSSRRSNKHCRPRTLTMARSSRYCLPPPIAMERGNKDRRWVTQRASSKYCLASSQVLRKVSRPPNFVDQPVGSRPICLQSRSSNIRAVRATARH